MGIKVVPLKSIRHRNLSILRQRPLWEQDVKSVLTPDIPRALINQITFLIDSLSILVSKVHIPQHAISINNLSIFVSVKVSHDLIFIESSLINYMVVFDPSIEVFFIYPILSQIFDIFFLLPLIAILMFNTLQFIA